jgi:hypothetical protein
MHVHINKKAITRHAHDSKLKVKEKVKEREKDKSVEERRKEEECFSFLPSTSCGVKIFT